MSNPNMSLVEATQELSSALSDFATDVNVKAIIDDLINAAPLPENRTNAPYPLRLEEVGPHNVRVEVTLTAHGVNASSAAQSLSQIIQNISNALGD
jgi:hypothetical protein